jgi:hypothetical protein
MRPVSTPSPFRLEELTRLRRLSRPDPQHRWLDDGYARGLESRADRAWSQEVILSRKSRAS